MKRFFRKNVGLMILVGCFWGLQLLLICFRVMRTQSFQEVSSQSGPQWERYQLFMNLDNRMGQIVCTVHVIFVVLAVLLVLGHLRLWQVLGTFAASYLGAWLLSYIGPAWGGAGLSNYTLELYLSFYTSALFLGIGIVVWAFRLLYLRIKRKTA